MNIPGTKKTHEQSLTPSSVYIHHQNCRRPKLLRCLNGLGATLDLPRVRLPFTDPNIYLLRLERKIGLIMEGENRVTKIATAVTSRAALHALCIFLSHPAT